MMKLSVLLILNLALSSIAQAANVPALLQWSQRVELGTPVSGLVQSVQGEVGQRVKKGQLLVSLDATNLRAAEQEIQASQARNRDEEQDAKRNLDRVQELYKRTVISSSELEAAQTRYIRAKTQHQEAAARLQRARKNLQEATVRAPFDAWIIERRVEPGQAVANQLQPQALMVIARAGEMNARAALSLAQIRSLKIGQQITVEANGKAYAGKIKSLGLEPSKNDATYPVDVVFATNEVLRAGTPATLKLP